MLLRSYLTICLVALLCAGGCAHPGLKDQAIGKLQATVALTGTAQDYEIAAYHAKTFPALTDQAHVSIQQAFVKIFDVQGKAAVAVDAWRAGDPAPTDLQTYVTDIRDALAVAKQLVPQAAPLLDKIQAALDSAAQLYATLKGGA